MNYLIKKLPIGIEFFEDIRTQDFYYVDKTNFIKELIMGFLDIRIPQMNILMQ